MSTNVQGVRESIWKGKRQVESTAKEKPRFGTAMEKKGRQEKMKRRESKEKRTEQLLFTMYVTKARIQFVYQLIVSKLWSTFVVHKPPR